MASAKHGTKLHNVKNSSVCLADYIDNWMQRIGITITGLYYDNVSIDDKIRYTYPVRHGGFGFSTLGNQMYGAYAASYLAR